MLLKHAQPWERVAWLTAIGIVLVSAFLGFVLLGSVQLNGPRLGVWNAICRALGLPSDGESAGEPQPPLRTPTRIAWTAATLAEIGQGNPDRGAPLTAACAACHGEQGVSKTDLFPTLAGMDAASLYKQLDDFRSGKRSSAVMNAIAQSLTPQAAADIAAYYAGRGGGLAPILGADVRAGRTLREGDPAIRLVFAGDPARGLPPCAACHGPSGGKLGAPSLTGQHPAYIERELAAFAQGMRQNDINQQMRTVASHLKQDEMHAVAGYYGAGGAGPAGATPKTATR